MTFIEFDNYVFPIEEVQCVERFYSWYEENNEKKWSSCLFLKTENRYFKFPEEKYEELKNILLNFNKKKTSLND